MLFPLALASGKLSSSLIRACGLGQGSNLPGRIARSICPGAASQIAKQSMHGVLAVSGTNGKSTTCGFIGSILRTAHLSYVHNRQGANLASGVTASLIDACSWLGKIDVDYCLFEIDEAALPVVAREMTLSAVAVTNLFRDQLDRFGELDTTAKLIDQGIQVNHAAAILNADDPNVAQLARGCPRVYFGLETFAEDKLPQAGEGSRELAYCPNCDHEYSYSRVFFAQLGHYFCHHCGSSRPAPAVTAREIQLSATSSIFLLDLPAESIEVRIGLPGLYNVYNALAAAAFAHYLRLPAAAIREGLQNHRTLFGRAEQITIEGKRVLIQLIKNPAGASQVVQSIVGLDDLPLLIAINDNLADGRDISWLWDADFEQLQKHKGLIIVSGRRGPDMAVRLKYAGVQADTILVEPDLRRAFLRALSSLDRQQTLCVLPTYTCLLELQKILKSMGCLLSETH